MCVRAAHRVVEGAGRVKSSRSTGGAPVKNGSSLRADALFGGLKL